MKKYSLTALFATFALFTLQVANVFAATCTLNGEVIPCDQMPVWPFYLMIGFFVFMMIASVFWIWMIVDVVKYEDEKEKMMWVLIVILAQVIGAAVYYFMRRRPRKRRESHDKDVLQNKES